MPQAIVSGSGGLMELQQCINAAQDVLDDVEDGVEARSFVTLDPYSVDLRSGVIGLRCLAVIMQEQQYEHFACQTSPQRCGVHK